MHMCCSSKVAVFVHDKSESRGMERMRAKKIGKNRLRVVFYQNIVATMEITAYVPNQPWFAGSGDNTTRMGRAMRRRASMDLGLNHDLQLIGFPATFFIPPAHTAKSEALRRSISKRQEYRCGRHERREFMSWW
nr:unnamed protein product [Haemonchus contortus]